MQMHEYQKCVPLCKKELHTYLSKSWKALDIFLLSVAFFCCIFFSIPAIPEKSTIRINIHYGTGTHYSTIENRDDRFQTSQNEKDGINFYLGFLWVAVSGSRYRHKLHFNFEEKTDSDKW
jgi:hypothetical protein